MARCAEANGSKGMSERDVADMSRYDSRTGKHLHMGHFATICPGHDRGQTPAVARKDMAAWDLDRRVGVVLDVAADLAGSLDRMQACDQVQSHVDACRDAR